MILYRPVGLQELTLIYDSGMQAFPARLPQQPIFYPVLQLEYARQTASGWNAKNGQMAGYVTEFKVEDDYLHKFETHAVGKSEYEELWIPAEEMEEFNRHISGHIKVVEAHFGEAFQGFVPEKFSLQGKNAVEQFTWLANSYLYKRMDFYLEIKRNHKAVFLNYPFWQTHDFKNPGLKEKIIQAIKEGWLTSFPKIPLPNPPPKETPPVEQRAAQALEEPVHEEPVPAKPTGASVRAQALGKPAREEISREEQIEPDKQESEEDVDEDLAPPEQTDLYSRANPVPAATRRVEESASRGQHWVKPLQEEQTHSGRPNPHLLQGIKLGLSGEYADAVEELSRAVEEDPEHVSAHTSLGVAFHRLGEDERALACYETALKIDPIYAEAHYFRANILYDRGNTREAIAGYTTAIGLRPELIEAHQISRPEDRLTDYSPSPAEMRWIARPAHRILDLNKLIESNTEQTTLFKERAAEYYRLRNYAQAIADYSSSLALQPEDANALHLRGVAYEQLGQSDRALEDFQQAVAIDPQLSNAFINRGVTFGQLGNLHQSIASLTDAIRLAPGNPDGYFNRGVMYFQQGDFESAIADFSRVIQLSSKDGEAYYWRGISNEAAGRQEEAIADYNRFLSMSQDPQTRAEIEHKLNQWQAEKQNGTSRRVIPEDRQDVNQVPSKKSVHIPDLYDLITALGERALHSTWFGSGVNCNGEKAEELYAFTDHERPIEGRELLSIASGIHETVEGDFQAFDPGATDPWAFLRAWEGSGFYLETNDPGIKQQLQAHFGAVEEVAGAPPPYEGMFIRR